MTALTIRYLPGFSDYHPVWKKMQQFVDTANDDTAEELWVLQHKAVYTLGRAADIAHLLRRTNIPVIRSDRGGQISYHGPGQIVAYLLLNLRRRQLGLRQLVRILEAAVIGVLAEYGVKSSGSVSAPGVYVDGEKIAALGLRVRRGWTYHGISFNIRMDLSPFNDINPCGYAGLRVTQAADKGISDDITVLMRALEKQLCRVFSLKGKFIN